MRYFLLAALACIHAVSLGAQAPRDTALTALYEVTTQIQRELPPELSHLESQLSSSTVVSRRLRYDGAHAVTDDAPSAPTAAQGGGAVQTRTASMGIVYLDVAQREVLKRRDFMGRQFLVTDSAPEIGWTLTQEKAEFLGYPAYKATAMVGSKSVEAWFTPSVAMSIGPEVYGGLPGLILVLAEDGGRRTFVAQDVSLAPLQTALVRPSEGELMTGEEYNTLVREKIERLKSGRRPGTVFIPANN